MVIEDHINHLGINPLMGGINSDGGVKFIDMSQGVFPSPARKKLDTAAEKQQVPIWRASTLHHRPSYETPAEIKGVRVVGADAVG